LFICFVFISLELFGLFMCHGGGCGGTHMSNKQYIPTSHLWIGEPPSPTLRPPPSPQKSKESVSVSLVPTPKGFAIHESLYTSF
jgi:hypothetical protein